MSSLSWDFPSPSTSPSDDGDDHDADIGDVDGRGRPEGASGDHDEGSLVDLMDREPSEREEIEALERELLEQLGRDEIEALEGQRPVRSDHEQPERNQPEPEQPEQVHPIEPPDQDQLEREQIEAMEREQLARMEQLGRPDVGSPEQTDQMEELGREQLEELEREQLRQLEGLEREQLRQLGEPQVDAAPRRPEPRTAATPGPDVPSWMPPSAAVAGGRPEVDADALADRFLAAATERRALDAATTGQPPPATEYRELSEPARAARAIVDQRHRNLIEANALLADARRVLAPIAYRGLSDRTYLRRKIILGIGEAVSLAVAFSTAFDVAPLEGLLLSGAIALAFVIAGDLGGILRLTAERSRLSAAVEDGVVNLDPRYLHILYYDRQPWLSIVGGATAALFAVAAVSVGVLRAANQGSLGLAAGLGLLTVSLAVAAAVSSWQHASLGAEIIDHLQREEEQAGSRLRRAAAARVLRNPQILTAAPTDALEVPWQAPEADTPWQAATLGSQAPNMDWQTPDVDRQAPKAEKRAKRPKRGGRAEREKPAKGEKRAGGLVGATAARGALALASLPGKFRRSEKKAAKRESAAADDYDSGPGPGAGGESAGPISDVTFTPPVRIQRKFP